MFLILLLFCGWGASGWGFGAGAGRGGRMSTMALAGHFDTQRPQLTQSAGSMTARLPCMDMACLGHALTQSVQPMQPVEQTFLTNGPLSGLLHPTCTLDFFGTRAMTPRGHSAAQAVYDGYAVFDVDRVELADFDAGAEAEASVCAGGRAFAGDDGGAAAVVEAHVDAVFYGLVVGAVALDEGDHRLRGFRRYAEDFGYFSGDVGAARGAFVGLAVAAGVAAAAAVGAGQDFAYFALAFVDGDVEFLGCEGEQRAEYDAEPSHYQCRVEYSFHVRPSYLMRPLKPMKAIDMRPAVTRAIGSPRMQRGISVFISIFSRMPAMRTMARRKPADEPKALVDEVVVLVHVDDGDAEDGAVRRDEREEDAEGFVEPGHHFLEHRFDELDERRDYQDERERVEVFQSERDEDEVVGEPRHYRREGRDEYDGYAHALRRLKLAGDSEERAAAEEAGERRMLLTSTELTNRAMSPITYRPPFRFWRRRCRRWCRGRCP